MEPESYASSYRGPIRVNGPADLYHAAVEGDCAKICLILSENVDPDEAGPSGCLPLIAASEQGNIEAVKALLDGDADVNQSDHTGQTAMMAVAAKSMDLLKDSHLQIAELLLSGKEPDSDTPDEIPSKADLNLTNPEGKTALDQATSPQLKALLGGTKQSTAPGTHANATVKAPSPLKIERPSGGHEQPRMAEPPPNPTNEPKCFGCNIV
eukprot:TRINITY_DN19668_c0_g1_i1.p1 TRINITY_DN19668_c0_g1~~TRINITY_DN19668_c0_g1_i1.p1  ORF type:complete len:210 (+),score=21.88 TRINITY_DN19668_c0_g1_i1:220-849(+)